MAEFFDMGGYAAYIWPAYIVSAAVLLVIAVQSYRALTRNRRDLALLQEAEGGRRQRVAADDEFDDAMENADNAVGGEEPRETQA